MPVGIIVNASCVLVGGLLGAFLGKHMPTRVRDALTFLFGISSMVLGITLLRDVANLPAVILSLILGTIIGELLRLEDKISLGSAKLKGVVEKLTRRSSDEDDQYITRFVTLLMLFCTSSTGILGALSEGMTGSATVLLTKSVLDLFTAFAFAASMGVLVALIAVPQLVLLLLFYALAGVIMPLTTPAMVGDFMACGGAIAIITGLRLSDIKQFRVTNILPAIVLVMPLSWLWTQLLG